MASKKILIADDDPDIIEILSTCLSDLGCEVCVAYNGEEALDKVQSEKPNLIITDVMMPRMTGYEFMKKVREDPELRGIPALVITDHDELKDYFDKISGVEFIPKTYHLRELVYRIEALLGKASVFRSSAKQVVLAGAEDFLIAKIHEFLSSEGYHILLAQNGEDAFNLAKNLRPSFILCQFWSDVSVLDANKLYEKIAANAEMIQVPLYVYCSTGLASEAMKTFRGERLITHADSLDLLAKLDALIKKMNSPEGASGNQDGRS